MQQAQDKPTPKSCLVHIYEHWLVQDMRLVALLHKAMTVALCVFYFSVVNQIPLEQILVQNSRALVTFILWAHVSSCFNLDFEPVWWQ